MTIIHKEHNGGVRGLIERMKALGKKQVYIGVPASKDSIHEGGINMATLLAVHTLGAPSKGIPQRDALRPPLINNKDKYVQLMATGFANALADGTDPNIVYEKIGIVASDDVKAYFLDGSFKELNEATVERKGSSKPLVDTGEMRNSITYEVR